MFNKAKYFIIPAASLALPLAVFAAQSAVPNNVIGFTLPVIIKGIVAFIIAAAFFIAFIMLLVGGIRWIVAGGDEKAVAGARGMITAALIGLVIVVAAYAIIKLAEQFFGFTIITNFSTPCIAKLAGGTCATNTVPLE